MMKNVLLVAVMVALTPAVYAQQQPPKGQEQPTIEFVVEQPKIEDLVADQRATAKDLLELVDGDGLKQIAALAPTIRGIGISYSLNTKTEGQQKTTYAIMVDGVYRDSSAGRAGILPGDWVTSVNGIALGSAIIATDDDAVIAQAHLEKLVVSAQNSFRDAPDSFEVRVDRGGRELTFQVSRGPIAPGLAAALTAKMDEYRKFYLSQRPKVQQLIRELASDTSDLKEVRRRNARIAEVLLPIGNFHKGIRKLVEQAQVPDPHKKK